MSPSKHVAIREWIEQEIHKGNFVEGQKLPTEQELMEQFQVSRAPVQQAMKALELTGVVVRRSGAGTFISSTVIRTSLLNYLRPDRTDAEEEGRHLIIGTRVTSAQTIPWAAPIFAANTPVAVVDRVKVHTSGKPIALERAAIDLTFCPEILDQDLELLTTIAYYNSIQLPVHRVTTQLSAELLTPAEAEALQILPEVPVIRQHRTVFTDKGHPLETAQFYTHPTHLTLEVTQVGN